jgi:CRP-like cAMP-binding protein
MYSEVKKVFLQKTEVSEKDLNKIIAVIEVRTVKRKKNILDAGDEPDYMYFLNKGLFRAYTYDYKGDEQTTDLISEGHWFGDFKSFISRRKATLYLEALEDCEVLLLSTKHIDRFCEEIPKFELALRQTIEYYFVKSLDTAKRIKYPGCPAQERYDEFTRKYPSLEKRVPSIYLASYLGIKPETLSRLRHAIGAEKK